MTARLKNILTKFSTDNQVEMEDLLVDFFEKSTVSKGLLERVHARVCENMRTVRHRQRAMDNLRAMHTPIKLLQLVLDMGATKTGYRSLISFCPASTFTWPSVQI